MSGIIGTWKLQTLDMLKEEKVINSPFGKNVNGLVIYQDNGYMSGIISGEGRPNVTSSATQGISESERLGISKNFIAYAGKYRIEEDLIYHKVFVSFLPNLLNEESHKSRFLVFKNSLITCSIPESTDKGGMIVRLQWEKVDV